MCKNYVIMFKNCCFPQNSRFEAVILTAAGLSSERFAPIKSAIFEEFSNFLPFLSKKNEKISIFALKFPVQCDIIIVNCIKCLWEIVK